MSKEYRVYQESKIILKDFIEEQSDLAADVAGLMGKSLQYQEGIKTGVEHGIKVCFQEHSNIVEKTS